MRSAADLSRSIRNELLAQSGRPVWRERFDQRMDSADHPEKVWREPPVDIFTFCTEFLERANLSDFHRDFFSAYAGPDPQVWDETYKLYALCWGLGAGKNFATEIVVAYTLYRLMLLIDPHRFFGLAPGGCIDILNISFVGEEQARRIFFDRLKQVVRMTKDPITGQNWFARRGVDLREHGTGDLQERVIELPRRVRARCLPFTSAGFEGSDILLCIVDEPSRAVLSPPANTKAHRLLGKILDNTTARFAMKGKVVMFSYPEAQDGDLIVESFHAAGTQFTKAGRRTREGDDVQTTWYASLGATYEVNPRRKREDFDHQRKTDPEGVATRIDCNPPHSKTGFYRAYPDKVRQSFKGCDPKYKAFDYEIVPVEHRVQMDGVLKVKKYTGIRLVKAWGDIDCRVLGGDPGERSDVFALALAHANQSKHTVNALVIKDETERVNNPPGMLGYQEQVVRRHSNLTMQAVDRTVWVDGIAEIVPIRYTRLDSKTGRTVTDTYPISFASVRDFIVQLKHHFPNLIAAGFDRWQSSELIEELLKAGISAESLTFTAQEQYDLYAQHRSLVYNDMVRCIPSPRAEQEFIDLQEVTPGRKVDHKPEGSKDVADAIVIATHLSLRHDVLGSGSYVVR